MRVEYVFFAFLAFVAGQIAWRYVRSGSFTGAMLGGRITRDLGEIPIASGVASSTVLRVHLMRSSDGEPAVVKSETLHWTYALLMFLGLILLLPGFRGRARTWWTVSLAIQTWHFFEHTLLLYQATVGKNFFGSPVPTSIGQQFAPSPAGVAANGPNVYDVTAGHVYVSAGQYRVVTTVTGLAVSGSQVVAGIPVTIADLGGSAMTSGSVGVVHTNGTIGNRTAAPTLLE